MAQWSLAVLLDSLHSNVTKQLEIARASIAHPGSKGDASESIWLQLLQTYLPKRYQAEKAFVVDSLGNFSEQIDIVIFDRQYTPFIFQIGGQHIIPAESVYAVFEAKQSLNSEQIAYAQNKAASVRKLHPTSLPIPHAGGVYPAKPRLNTLAGIITLESDYSPKLGDTMLAALNKGHGDARLDIGCIAQHGIFELGKNGLYQITPSAKAATHFIFRLVSLLQEMGTVPMIDIGAYSKWLDIQAPAKN